MELTNMRPPSCCLIAQSEGGALGYGIAVLLDKIKKVGVAFAIVGLDHANKLAEDMVGSFLGIACKC
jgi:hypothetical protein